MEIICPECQFSRQVDESKIPPRSQVATCPKCQAKFQFRELPEQDDPARTTPEPEKAAPQSPEPESATPQPPSPASLPTPEEVEPDFPPLHAPGEDSKDELWDKLRDMRPPKASEDKEPTKAEPDASPGQNPIPGWTGEFNNDFPDPMKGEPSEEPETATPQVPPPFEQLDRYGFFHGLYMTIKLVLLSPRLFFSVMPVGGGLAKPLTFTILVTMIQGMVQYIWGMAGMSTATEGVDSVGGLTGTVTALLMLLVMPAFIAMGQFVITSIYHFLLMIMRGDNQGFEGTFRALAYANAPIVLGLFPMPMVEIEVGWMVIAGVWGLFLTIIGLRYIHKTTYAKVIPVALVPLLLGMIAALVVYQGQMPTV
jgi:predicted Zn finger-like uncharacterized protein